MKEPTEGEEPKELDYSISLENYIKEFSLQPGLSSVDQMKRIFPSLLNRYSRKYFLSADKKYRITIDNNLYYLKISRTNFSFMNCFINRNNIILEIKYNENDDVNIDQITQSLPLRYSKNSKYIDGISQINFSPS